MLPGIDGYQVCREIRARSNTPIIMLSAKGEVFDKVLGLELGADDYIMKPFDAKELVARVKLFYAAIRLVQNLRLLRQIRENVSNTRELRSTLLITPSLLTDIPLRCLRRNWNFSISSRPLRTRYSQESSLLDQIWGYEYVGDTRTVDVHIKRLREKIKDHNGWSLSTVWGIGYKFEVK